jgi:acylphosphatase
MADTVPQRVVRLIVTGHVQGVWYRGRAVEQANAVGIKGSVRNRSDGAVEIIAAGASDVVASFILACRNGPPAAVISNVEIIEETDKSVPAGPFRQLTTT